MTISFSGLASGLDTTSWVESLVQLKQAKVSELDEKKQALALCRETLNSIKTFFNSFRSVIDKVTDSKFGIESMDIFAQKLATSSDTSILTALATSEAEEATYNIDVNQLATNTQALSKAKTTTNISRTEIATMSTLLTDLGVKTGDVGINANGVPSVISISSSDTISSFIGKLRDIGVEASYNEQSGIFSAKLNRNDIDDTISNTGIADILHLTQTGGYESSYLETKQVETITTAATGTTKLSELGEIQAGNIEVKSGENSYVIAISGNTTLSGLIGSLAGCGVEASLSSNGVFTITNAEIVDTDSTGIIEALGLVSDINSKTQSASDLKYQTIVTTASNATGATKLKELEVWSSISPNPTLQLDGVNVDVNGEMTLSELVSALNTAGASASFSNGQISVSGGELSGTVADALGLSPGGNTTSIYQSGTNYIKSTVVAYATGDTKLGELGISTGETFKIYASDNNTTPELTYTCDSNTTLNSLFSYLNTSYGISGSITDGRITLSSDSYYISGTVADKLGLGVESSATTSTVGSSITSTLALSYTSTVCADESSKISDYVTLSGNDTIFFADTGEFFDISSSTTFGDFISACETAGINASMTNGILSFNGYAQMQDFFGSVLADLGITTVTISDTRTTVAKSVTSSAAVTYTENEDVFRVTEWRKTLTNTYDVSSTADGGTVVLDGTTYTVAKTRDTLYSNLSSNKNVILGSDIDLSGENWTPINGYRYNFNGNGFVISNLTVDTDAEYAGMFGSVRSGATISNIALDTVSVTTSLNYTYSYTGALIGENSGSISNCVVYNATVIGHYAGGLIGTSAGDLISDCSVYNSTVYDNGTGAGCEIGGLIGVCYTDLIKNCNVYNTGVTSKLYGCRLGGLVGRASSQIEDCNVYNASVHATASSGASRQICYAGGLVGQYSCTGDYDIVNCKVRISASSISVTFGYKGVLIGDLLGEPSGTHSLGATSVYDNTLYTGNAIGYNGSSLSNDAIKFTGAQVTIPTRTVNMTSTTKLTDLGFSTNGGQPRPVLFTNESSISMAIGMETTVGDLQELLADYGFSSSITDGKLTINSTGSDYITGIDTPYANIFKLKDGEGETYISSGELILGTSDSDTQQTTATITATSGTTLGDLGFSGVGTIVTQNTSGVFTTVTVNSSTTLDSLPGASVSNGKVTLSPPSGSSYIYSVSQNLLDTLKFSGSGNGKSYTVIGGTDYHNVNTSALSVTTTTIANTTSKLSSLDGVPANKSLTVQTTSKDGIVTTTTLNYTGTETLGSLFTTLSSKGITATIDSNGLISLSSTSLADFTLSGDLADFLLGSGTKIYSIESNLNTEDVVTATVGATESTLLSELGVSTGEYYIYKNGVKYVAQISSGDTVGSLIATLHTYGIEAELTNNGSSSSLVLTGSGNSYIATSPAEGASNVAEKLFGGNSGDTSYNYVGDEKLYNTVTTNSTATEDTLLSVFDTPWGDTTLKSAGNLAFVVNGANKSIQITDDETFGSLVNKLKSIGVQSSFMDGKLYISNADGVSINSAATTSAIINPNAGIKLTYQDEIDGFSASSTTITTTSTIIQESSVSVSNYADMSTKLNSLNISSGTFTIYRDDEKASITIDKNWDFAALQSAVSAKFSDVELSFENGYLEFRSKNAGSSVKIGSTTDSSNFLAITGMHTAENGKSVSARELYKVNTDSLVMSENLFREGNVTSGYFIVGNAKINIDEQTTLGNIISQINNSDEANATAWWDSIGGNLVIKSRTTGAALINIEAGTSNFTDIMGYTNSEWAADGSLNVTRMNTASQEVGNNAKFSINGTYYTSTSNNITSDVSRIKGLTINLKGLTDGSAITLTVERDKETLANAVSDIVDSYNELMDNVDKEITKDGKLKDQSTLKLIRNQLRSMMTSSDAGTTIFRNLDAIGIKVEAASGNNISTSGLTTLTFDKDKFFEAFKADQGAVKDLLVGSKNNTGIFTKVEDLVESSLKSVSGYFESTDKSYQKQINKLDNKIEKQKTALERYRAQLESKFSSMDILIANMQQQYSSFLRT